MNFNQYQLQSREFAVYRNMGKNLIYTALGLAGETGEFVDNVKKMIRDYDFKEGDNTIPDGRRKMAVDELGDCLWYIANCATELGISLDELAVKNINKLTLRKINGKIHGR